MAAAPGAIVSLIAHGSSSYDDQEEETDDEIQEMAYKKNANAYDNKITQIIIFFDKVKRSLLSEEFLREAKRGQPDTGGYCPLERGYIKGRLWRGEMVTVPPIEFSRLLCEDFTSFLGSVNIKKSQSTMSMNTCGAYRSALKDLARRFEVSFSAEFEKDLKKFFKDLSKSITDTKHSIAEPDPMYKGEVDVTLLQWICRKLQDSIEKEYIFGRLYLLLMWNLRSRMSQIDIIYLSQLTLHEGVITVHDLIHKSESDNLRSAITVNRHLYANPLDPSLCTFTTLATYFLMFPLRAGQSLIFEGSNQAKRFQKFFSKRMEDSDFKAQLEQRNLSSKIFSSYFIRKGPSHTPAILSGGSGISSDGVSDGSGVCLETGWASPYFRDSEHPDVISARTVLFPNMPPSFGPVMTYALASLVHHFPTLDANLPAKHPLRSSLIFRERSITNGLSKLIVSRATTKAEDAYFASQIPTHPPGVSMSMSLHPTLRGDSLPLPLPSSGRLSFGDLSSSSSSSVAIAAAAAAQVNVFSHMGQSTLPHPGASAMQYQSQPPRIERPTPTRLSSSQPPEVPPTPLGEDGQPLPVGVTMIFPGNWHHYEGKMYKVPQTYDVPTGGPLTAFQVWCLGDPQHSVSPLRTIENRALPTARLQRRFGELRFLMKRIEDKLQRENRWIENPTIEQVNQMFEYAKDTVTISDTMESGRKRRSGQMEWTTLAKEFRLSYPSGSRKKKARTDALGPPTGVVPGSLIDPAAVNLLPSSGPIDPSALNLLPSSGPMPPRIADDRFDTN